MTNRIPSDLLTKLSWNPSHDTLFFAGDVLAKSEHDTSLAVWDFIYDNHLNSDGRQVIYPVRGNHDQMVVQWRAWRDWFEGLVLPSFRHHPRILSFLPLPSSFLTSLGLDFSSTDDTDSASIHTGRDFLNLIEAEWVFTKTSSTSPPDPEEYVDVARKRARGTWRESWWAHVPEAPSSGREKKNWKMFTDHYWLARDMPNAQAEWMKNEVPLVNWVRSVHAFVAHAGLLPADPKVKMDDARQPLARVPSMGSEAVNGRHVAGGVEENNVVAPGSEDTQVPLESSRPTDLNVNVTTQWDIPALRRLQERAILTDVPQNTEPWVVLNMRSVKDSGKVTRKMDIGTPWSDLWADAMGRCRGFGLSGEDEAFDSYAQGLEDADVDRDIETFKKHGSKKYKLKCYPSTVVYGHAATRGLDIKRWSFGLDTGCLYGQKLTALVLSRRHDEEDEEDEDSAFKSMKFGDKDAHIRARLVSVKCPNLDDDDDD